MRRAALFLFGLLAACAAGPRFAEVAGSLPPPPPGAARIFFYRWYEPYETLSQTTAYLNGAPVGVTQPGSVLYRDVPPGQYAIKVDSYYSFPNQFKTVQLAAGDTLFVRVESLHSWSGCTGNILDCPDTFAVSLQPPGTALAEMGALWLIPG